ncbi:MAG TPA: T9SS type A sorting domain-containing protein [Saprospiraceae bacterium]|nr:T9SS type A sorting domain-containing protein [Saprospiraceae bacterium]
MQIHSLSFIVLSLCISCFSWAQEASKIVFEDENGCLRYVSDSENNYIPDFSYAGYKNGEVPLPELEVVKTISAIEGDNTAHIQAALDEIAALPMDENGFRGALLLEAGAYEIHGTVVIRESGIVLRGVGDDSDPTSNTILLGVGNTPTERDIIQAGNTPNISWSQSVPGTNSTVTSDFVPAGSRSLEVTAPELYSEGNNVIIRHPSTSKWLASINFGDTDSDAPWSPGTIDILYNRYVTAVDFAENKIVLDAPIYDHFERDLAQAEVYVLNKEGIKQNIGIESLRVDIQTAGPLTENHAKNAIRLIGVEDSWVRDVTALHFIYAAVDTRVASRVTVRDCRGLQPHSEITGARRYNFAVGRMSNQILFEGCHATQGRHSYVSNGTSSVSGIVFYNCTSEVDYSSSEGHRRWSQGMLFDNITFSRSETNTLLGLYNRGRFGTGHGWSAVHSVAWRVKVPLSRNIKLQKPPGRQNYAIACEAYVTNLHNFPHPKGYEGLTRKTPLIPSLYTKQLEARLQQGVPPDAPAQLTAQFSEGMVMLNWMDIASRETGYSIEWSTDGGNSFTEIARLPADQTAFLHTDFPDVGSPLIYRVFAIGDQCPSPYSNPAQVAVATSTASVALSDLKVFPNPFQDAVNIQTDAPLKQLILFDSSGKEMMQKTATLRLQTEGLAKGVYYLQIIDQQGSTRLMKMIKQ